MENLHEISDVAHQIQEARKLSRAFTKRIQNPIAIAYADCRSRFRSGDLLCFRGSGPVSTTIRLLTRSNYSHVGLVFWYEERNYCIEAVGSGVRIILMSELQRRYHGRIDYFEVLGANDAQRRDAIGFCFAQLGKIYDKPGIFRFLLLLIFGHRLKASEDNKWFCSELVAAAYAKQELPLAPVAAFYTSPHDLTLSDRVAYRFTVQ